MSRMVMRTLMAAGVALVTWTGSVQAQTAPIYSADELSERPQLLSPGKTADLIRAAYTSELKAAGVAGTVQLAFVIDEQGKVEAESVKIVAASMEGLGEAAKKVAPKLEFKPGKKDAKAVRTSVVLPLVFR